MDCPGCDDRVSSASPKCPNCGHVLVDTSEAIFQEPTAPDEGPSRVSPAASGAPPRSQSNWVVGLVIAAITGVILVGVAAAVVLAGSISISNPFEDIGAIGVSATETTEVSEATTTAPDDDSYGLLVGDCIDDDELERYIAGEEFATVSCDDPHGNEVYLVHEFAPGPYPGEDAVREDLVSVCEDEFEGYVGRAYESSSLDVYVTWPGSDLWASGERIGECLLYDVELDDLTGSAYQSGW